MNIASVLRVRAIGSPNGTAALRRPYPIVAALLILGAGALHLLTLRPGSDWDGDYALYILHAINIVQGAPYAETGYLFNPDSPAWPASYPPGLPLLLAPVYAVFGLDIEAMKVLLVLCFLGFLAVFAVLARRALAAGPALAALAVLAFNPFLLEFKNTLLSEFAFLLFGYLALHLTDRLEDGLSGPARIVLVVAAGLALGFAYEIRTAGMVLFCAVAAVGALRFRATGGSEAGVLLVGGLTAWIIGSLFPGDIATYLGFFEEVSLADLITESGGYGYALATMTAIGQLPPPMGWAMGAVMAGLAAAGIAHSLASRISVFDLFFGGYAVLLVLYPVKEEPARYALPLLPLLFLYVLRGAHRLGRAAGGAGAWTTAAVVGLIALAYAPALTSVPVRPADREESATSPAVQAFFGELKARLPEDAIVMTEDPTIVPLFTGRRATLWAEDLEDEDQFRHNLAESGAQYLIENRAHRAPGQFPFTEDIIGEMDLVLDAGTLVLYRVR